MFLRDYTRMLYTRRTMIFSIFTTYLNTSMHIYTCIRILQQWVFSVSYLNILGMFAYTIAITLITALLALLEPDDEVEEDEGDEGKKEVEGEISVIGQNYDPPLESNTSSSIEACYVHNDTQSPINQPPYTNTKKPHTQYIHTHTHIIIHKHHLNLLLLAGRLIVGWAWEQLLTYTLMTIVLYILKSVIYNIYLRTCIKIIVSIIMIIIATYIKLYHINNKNSIT